MVKIAWGLTVTATLVFLALFFSAPRRPRPPVTTIGSTWGFSCFPLSPSRGLSISCAGVKRTSRRQWRAGPSRSAATAC